MTHDEIKKLAREMGVLFVPKANSSLVRIIQKAVALEREGCATLVDSWNTAMTDKLAEAIRARGQA